MNTSSTFFQGLGQFVNELFSFLENSDIQIIIQSLSALLGVSVTLWIILEAYSTMLGKSDNSIRELIYKMVSAMLFVSISLNLNGYLDSIAIAFTELHHLMSGDISLYSKIDKLFDEAIALANNAYKATPSNLGGAILGVICMIIIYSGFVVGALPAFIIVVTTEITLKILLMLLPIAIYSLVYKFSKQIFTQWLNIFISNSLTILLVGLLLSAVLETYIKFQQELLVKIASSIDVTTVALQSLIMGILLLGLVKIAKGIAEKLGTVSIESLSSSLGNQIKDSAKNTIDGTNSIRKAGVNAYNGARNVYQDTKGFIKNKIGGF